MLLFTEVVVTLPAEEKDTDPWPSEELDPHRIEPITTT